MNDQLATDQRQLEKATQRQPLSNGSGTTDLNLLAARQAWLAMGKAAEAAGREGLDEQALLASLQSQLLKTQPEPKPAETAPQVDWSWAAVGLAAAVLIAATIFGALQRPEVIPNHIVPTIAQPAPSPEPEPQSIVKAESVKTESTPDGSWTDLDDAIQTTYTALQQLSQQRSGVDQSLNDFDTQLKQLSADIAGESL